MTALSPEGLPPSPRRGASWAPCVRLYLFEPYDRDPRAAGGEASRPEGAPPDPRPEPGLGLERPA
jgi:hypothetical protein